MSVNVHVFRAGEHKSAVEPFIRDDMSSAEKEVTAAGCRCLWDQYTLSVEAQRELAPARSTTTSTIFPSACRSRVATPRIWRCRPGWWINC